MEKLTIRQDNDIDVYEIWGKPMLRFWTWNAINILSYRLVSRGMIKWSPKGTYFALTKHTYIIICKVDGDLKPMSAIWHPLPVSHVDFSPSGKYLASYYMWGDEVNIRIHDVRSGTLLKDFRGSDCNFLRGRKLKDILADGLPLIRWSKDDKYASLIEKTSLSIYAGEALLTGRLTKISNVTNFCWSPTDRFLALLQYGDSDGDILVRIIRFPEEKDVVDTVKLKSVCNLRICWHEGGKYVAFTYKNVGEDENSNSGILIFKIDIHKSASTSWTSFMRRNSVVSFSFEPRGDRFGIIHGGEEGLWLEIRQMDMNMKNNFQDIQVLKVEANAMNWSPAGGVVMVSGCDNLLLYDANKRVILLQDQYKTEAVEWSPSGRCVAAYVSVEKKVAVWHCSGELLYVIPIRERFHQLLWCPPLCNLFKIPPFAAFDHGVFDFATLFSLMDTVPKLSTV